MVWPMQNEEQLFLYLKNSVPLWSSPHGTHHLFIYSLWQFQFLHISILSLTVCPTQILIFLRVFQSSWSHLIMINSGHPAWPSPPTLLAVVWGDIISTEVNLKTGNTLQLSPPRYTKFYLQVRKTGFGPTAWIFSFRGSGSFWNIYFHPILLSQWRDTKMTLFLPALLSQKPSGLINPPLRMGLLSILFDHDLTEWIV